MSMIWNPIYSVWDPSFDGKMHICGNMWAITLLFLLWINRPVLSGPPLLLRDTIHVTVEKYVNRFLRIFTTRQWSCRKVIFSFVSVCQAVILSTGRPMWQCDSWCIGPHHIAPLTWHLNAQGPPTSDIWWPRFKTCSNFFTRGPPPLPLPVLTSLGYCSTYGWQVGRTHPTGMLSCIWCKNIYADLLKVFVNFLNFNLIMQSTIIRLQIFANVWKG